MTYREMEEAQEVKRKELLAKMREIGCYPVTQHPDYDNDLAFDIDDVIEFVEKLKEQKMTNERLEDACEIKVGQLFYNIDSPSTEWEVIRVNSMCCGLYFWLVNFETREVRLKERSVLKDDNKYFEYFKTEKEAIKQVLDNMRKKLKEKETEETVCKNPQKYMV